MAIVKELESSYGISASYHKIDAISINYSKKQITLCVSSYVSKNARIKCFEPIDVIDIEIPQSDFNLFKEDKNIIEIGYKWLKVNVNGFEDSTDDLDDCSRLLEDKNDTIK